MTFFIAVILSALISFFLKFPQYRKLNNFVGHISLYAVLFSLGVSLGADKTFFSNIQTLGAAAITFALSGSLFSAFSAWILTRRQK